MNMKYPNHNSSFQNGDDAADDLDGYLSDLSDNSDIDVPVTDNDFSEFMWMENEQEFDSQVLKELEEEEMMRECLEAMMDDETDALATSVAAVSINGGNDQMNGIAASPTTCGTTQLPLSASSTVNGSIVVNGHPTNRTSRFSVQSRLNNARNAPTANISQANHANDITSPVIDGQERQPKTNLGNSELNPFARIFIPGAANHHVSESQICENQ